MIGAPKRKKQEKPLDLKQEFRNIRKLIKRLGGNVSALLEQCININKNPRFSIFSTNKKVVGLENTSI